MECLLLGFRFIVLSLRLDATLTKRLQESWITEAVDGVLRHDSRGVLGALAGAQRSLVGIEVLDNKGETRDNNQMDLKIMSFILDEK